MRIVSITEGSSAGFWDWHKPLFHIEIVTSMQGRNFFIYFYKNPAAWHRNCSIIFRLSLLNPQGGKGVYLRQVEGQGGGNWPSASFLS